MILIWLFPDFIPQITLLDFQIFKLCTFLTLLLFFVTAFSIEASIFGYLLFDMGAAGHVLDVFCQRNNDDREIIPAAEQSYRYDTECD